MREINRKILKNNLRRLAGTDTDWSVAADIFVRWLLDHPESESFEMLRGFLECEGENWIVDGLPEEDRGSKCWDDFFGYGDDFESFARDWVDEDETKSYLRYAAKRK